MGKIPEWPKGYKPMNLRDFEARIAEYGWYIEKGSIDWKLRDEHDRFKAAVKVIHPGMREVSAETVKKTRNALKTAGLE